jgi:hypothetical protein
MVRSMVYRSLHRNQSIKTLPAIPNGGICLFDKKFCSFHNLAKLRQRRISVISPLHQKRDPHKLIKAGKRIGSNQWLVRPARSSGHARISGSSRTWLTAGRGNWADTVAIKSLTDPQRGPRPCDCVSPQSHLPDSTECVKMGKSFEANWVRPKIHAGWIESGCGRSS